MPMQRHKTEWRTISFAMPAPLDVVSDGAPTSCPCKQPAQMCAHLWTNDHSLSNANTTSRARAPGRTSSRYVRAFFRFAWARATPSRSARFWVHRCPEWRTPMSCRRRAVLRRSAVTRPPQPPGVVHHVHQECPSPNHGPRCS